jgi:biotin synthase-like enzyme
MHGVIVTREGLDCHHPVEFEYYSNPKATTSWFDKEMCAYCAGSSGAKGFVEEHLTIEWKRVLLICKDCRADGAITLARNKRRNGAANAKRIQRDRLINDVPQANVDVVSPLEATDTSPTTTHITPRATKRGRRVDSKRSGKRPRRRLPRGVRG